tara:strand:- start:3987 stop:5150 length:1164 start_codon:yes stop_codon:yes gene_type:complete
MRNGIPIPPTLPPPTIEAMRLWNRLTYEEKEKYKALARVSIETPGDRIAMNIALKEHRAKNFMRSLKPVNIISVCLFLTAPNIAYLATVNRDIFLVIDCDESLLDKLYLYRPLEYIYRGYECNIACFAKLSEAQRFESWPCGLRTGYLVSLDQRILTRIPPPGFFVTCGESSLPLGVGYELFLVPQGSLEVEPTPIQVQIGCRALGVSDENLLMFWEFTVPWNRNLVVDLRSRQESCPETGISVTTFTMRIFFCQQGLIPLVPNCDINDNVDVIRTGHPNVREITILDPIESPFCLNPTHGFKPWFCTNGPLQIKFNGILVDRPEGCTYDPSYCNAPIKVVQRACDLIPQHEYNPNIIHAIPHKKRVVHTAMNAFTELQNLLIQPAL